MSRKKRGGDAGPGGGVEAPKGPRRRATRRPRRPAAPRSLSRLMRTPHARRCLFCKELAENAALRNDDEYGAEVLALVSEHVKGKPDPEAPPCRYTGCLHHERVDEKAALALVRIGRGDRPWRDNYGNRVSNIPFAVKEDDKPEGFEIGRDCTHKEFKNLPTAAGEVYVRFGPKFCEVHVWVDPAYSSRRESVDDVAAIWEIKEVFQKKFAPLREWVMRKWQELRALVEMDGEFEGDNKQE